MNKPLVIDIYHGDVRDRAGTDPDFAAIKAFGIIGVIHKASQGASGFDGTYSRRRKLALAQGLLWGAYHFLTQEDGDAQARNFLRVAELDSDTFAGGDWENYPTPGQSPSTETTLDFFGEIAAQKNRLGWLYSGNVVKERIVTATAAQRDLLGQHPFWLCEYGPNAIMLDVNKHPLPWAYPKLWQNNGDNLGPGPHSIPGIRGNCDNNTIVDPMTVDDLIAQWAT